MNDLELTYYCFLLNVKNLGLNIFFGNMFDKILSSKSFILSH